MIGTLAADKFVRSRNIEVSVTVQDPFVQSARFVYT